MTSLAAGTEQVTVPTLVTSNSPPGTQVPQPTAPPTVTTPAVSTSSVIGTTPDWHVAWGASGISTAPISTGAVIGLHSAGYDAITSGTEPLGNLQSGDVVKFDLGNFTGRPVQVVPFAWARDWNIHFAQAQELAPGWSTITWTVPAASSGIGQIGLQVNNGSGYVGELELSQITYSTLVAPAVVWTMPAPGKSITWKFAGPTWSGYQGWSQAWDVPQTSTPTYLSDWGWLWPWALPSATHRVVLTFFTNGQPTSVYSPPLNV